VTFSVFFLLKIADFLQLHKACFGGVNIALYFLAVLCLSFQENMGQKNVFGVLAVVFCSKLKTKKPAADKAFRTGLETNFSAS